MAIRHTCDQCEKLLDDPHVTLDEGRDDTKTPPEWPRFTFCDLRCCRAWISAQIEVPGSS